MTSEISDKEEQNPHQDQSQDQQQEIVSKEENTQILIKNLPESATEELLQKNFEKFGKIIKIKIEQDMEGKPTGNAIIDFETKQEKDLALNSNEEFELEGKKIEIKDPINEGRTLFVGNIPYSSTKEDIVDFFSDCGKVNVKFFTINQKFKGYAHVTFQDENAVDNALKKNGEKIDGREIKIDRLKARSFLPVVPRGGRRGRGFRGRGRGGGPSFGHFYRERKENYFRERRDRDRDRDRYRDLDRDRDRGRPYDRIRDRDRDREWIRDIIERSRSRDYNRMRDRNERNDRERGERERERDRNREFDKDRGDRDRDRDRERERIERDRDRGDRERDRGDRDRIKEREREGERHNRDYERDRDRERERRHSNYDRDNGYRERD